MYFVACMKLRGIVNTDKVKRQHRRRQKFWWSGRRKQVPFRVQKVTENIFPCEFLVTNYMGRKNLCALEVDCAQFL